MLLFVIVQITPMFFFQYHVLCFYLACWVIFLVLGEDGCNCSYQFLNFLFCRDLSLIVTWILKLLFSDTNLNFLARHVDLPSSFSYLEFIKYVEICLLDSKKSFPARELPYNSSWGLTSRRELILKNSCNLIMMVHALYVQFTKLTYRYGTRVVVCCSYF